MTTITNFIQGNFITGGSSEAQRPIWVVDSEDLETKELMESLVSRCGRDKKPLIRWDLGLSTLSKLTKQTQSVISESGVCYAKLKVDHPVFMVQSRILQRCCPGFLLQMLAKINKDIDHSLVLKKNKENTVESWGLLIEGLQTFTVLNTNRQHSQLDIQSFVGALTTLSPKIKQIVVVSKARQLSVEVNFALERISTCLTRFTSRKENQWQCVSTVRRYTGYFKEEKYVISLKEGRVKVNKFKAQKQEEKSEMQAELFDGLGFKAQKDQEAKKRQQELREMIYPHLRVQSKSNCQKTGCGNECGCSKPVPEDLIVLDEQQQDEDDIDV